MKAPIIVQLELTNLCNFKCPHCYRFDNFCHLSYRNEVRNVKQFFKIAEKLKNLEIFEVVLTGGEPLMEPKLLIDLINYFNFHNITISINTNLSLLNKQITDSEILNKIKSILISCPSADPIMYKLMTGGASYEVFEEKLSLLSKNFNRYFINMVVNKNNLHHIKKTAIKLKQLGVKNFGATPMLLNSLEENKKTILNHSEILILINDLVWIHENLKMKVDIFEALPKCIYPKYVLDKNYGFTRRKCQAGVTTISISPNGDVRPCPNNMTIYGNILQDDFDNTWLKMKNWRERLYTPENCHNCSFLKSCFGACRVNAKNFKGSLKSNDPWMRGVVNYKQKDIKTEYNFKMQDSISINGDLQYRQEDQNYYLVCIKQKNNFIKVNLELLKFLFAIREKPCYNLINIAGSEKKFFSEKFQNVIKFLLIKKIVILNKKRKE